MDEETGGVVLRDVSPGEEGEFDWETSLLDEFEVWTHDPTMADLDGFAAEVDAVDRQ